MTHLDPRPVAIGPVDGEEILVKFASASTLAKGTILGRKTTTADTYNGTITGTGTRAAVLSARPGKSLKAGAYALVATTMTSGVGTWTLTDPDGQTQTDVTTVSTEDLQFPNLGVDISIADTGTNFVTNDSIAFTVVAATGKGLYVAHSSTGTNGAQNPCAVLPDALTASAPGNLPARAFVRGDVNQNLLNGGAAISSDLVDALRRNGIFPRRTQELGKFDN